MPELAGQIQQGRELSEKECFEIAIEGLRTARDHLLDVDALFFSTFAVGSAIESTVKARDGLRGMSLLRGDMRWQQPVRQLDLLIDQMRERRGFKVGDQTPWIMLAGVFDGLAHRVEKLKDRGGRPLLWLPHLEPRR